MNPLTRCTMVIAVAYLATFLFRLCQYVREAGLSSNRLNTRICLIGFFSGFTYFVGNYEIQEFLHVYMSFIPFPIAPMLWIFSGVIGTSYLYIDTVRRFTVFNIANWISSVLFLGIGMLTLANLVLYKQVPFYRLQVIDGLIGSILCIAAAISVTPMMMTVLKSEQKTIHRDQFLLTIVQVCAATATAILLILDSIHKIWFDIRLIYTPLYIATVISHTIQIIVTHMMNEGISILWIRYPSKLCYYFKLKRLHRTVQKIVQAPDPYDIPLPTIPLPHYIDTMTYRVFIMIADRYWRIEKSEPLRQRIDHVLTLDVPPDIMLQQLGAVKKDKRR